MALTSPLGVAIIGSGIFVKEEHLPAALNSPLLSLKAIFSRSIASAREAAALIPGLDASASTPDLYAADAPEPGRTFEDLLRRQDVSAVIVALPIVAQPEFVRAALSAGKHVLAEKPIAKDVATARTLMAAAHEARRTNGATLCIAENYRFMPRLLYARDEARRLGRVTHFSIKVMMLMEPEGKWARTPWRREPEYDGGFLLDGGVHFAAAARLLLAGDGNRPAAVRAWTRREGRDLPALDTVTALVRTASGATGTFQHSAATLMSAMEWDLACEGGTVRSVENEVTVQPRGGDATVKRFERSRAVREEVAAWAKGVIEGAPCAQLSPEEALADLEFMEKMFRSGEQDGALLEYELQNV
ncbi:hypothetical protein HIM_08164 [Hirsutella minnesotensis 3608]|uniref:Gfo/Idh/MocA-like oxidoreductase N-terminal domain-containing protein n=1 Tax=Hirsutella minnesotensis 3608 TaxID=1043627 RepID=A0A0F7ZMS2_9HYPO|nr:hypothetical protein HIM_08164 [Hirsutella minnesotensis 3608]